MPVLALIILIMSSADMEISPMPMPFALGSSASEWQSSIDLSSEESVQLFGGAFRSFPFQPKLNLLADPIRACDESVRKKEERIRQIRMNDYATKMDWSHMN